MSEVLFEKIGEKSDPEWILKHCLNKLTASSYFSDHIRGLYEDGFVAGELNWSIQKWSDEVGEEFNVGPYGGYMAFVGGGEHGYGDSEEYMSFHSEREFMDYLSVSMDWYQDKHPDKKVDIDNLRSLFGL